MSAPTTSRSGERYVPALGYRWLTGAYDPLLALTMREQTFRSALVAEAEAGGPPDAVADLGCGTGSTTVLLAKAFPAATITGIDGDDEVLGRARDKASREQVSVELVTALADELPLADQSQDVVVSSLLFHHLDQTGKREALNECARVLRPGGRLHIADWGKPHDPLMRAAFYAVQVLDGFDTTRLNVAGGLPGLVESAGFETVQVTHRFRTLFGTLDLIAARKPRS